MVEEEDEEVENEEKLELLERDVAGTSPKSLAFVAVA